MANGLSGLIPTLYEAMDVVAREQVGMIPAVTRSSDLARVEIDQIIRVPVVPIPSTQTITPGVTAPNDGDWNLEYFDITMKKQKAVPIRWNGMEQRQLRAGVGHRAVLVDQISNSFRALCNEMEVDLCGLHSTFSRAVGTPGTTPLATATDDAADLKQLFDDNGCPASDRHVVINTNAGNKFRKNSGLLKVNESGDSSLLRQGRLGELSGFDFRESAGINTHTKGTGASATTNNAGYAKGARVITLASAGTGTVKDGDVIQFAGDTNKYVVEKGDTDVSNGGTITLARPGLMQAIPTAATNITVLNNSVRNLAFRRSALLLATRAPSLPQEGDMADDREMITDPHTGISYEIAVYKQYRQVRYELSLAWGWANVKPEFTHLLLG